MGEPTGAVPGLVVDGVAVAFGAHQALRGVDLVVAPGEIMAICGPSGCGKSTLLRVVAGLQVPDRGRVVWAGQDLAAVPVHDRPVGLMFQDHALFPHRSVGDNVGFGLRMAKVPRARRDARVREMLHLVGLDGFDDRPVNRLSGGEAQRVALARALAPAPALLLLDEPLGSLDRARREELAGELRVILGFQGITAVHVTHDHDEAVTVGDRLAVLLDGRVAQVDEPLVLRRRPASGAVARFLGVPEPLDPQLAGRLGLAPGSVLALAPAGAGGPQGTVAASTFRDGRFHHQVHLASGERVVVADAARLAAGTVVGVTAAAAVTEGPGDVGLSADPPR